MSQRVLLAVESEARAAGLTGKLSGRPFQRLLGESSTMSCVASAVMAAK